MNIRNTVSLTKIYLENFFSISSFFEDFKNGPKKIAKNFGIIFAALYMIGAYGFMLGFSLVSMYKGLEPIGLQNIVLVYSAVTAAMVTFFFGFLNASSTYVAGSNEDAVRAMPLRSREILTAKYCTVFAADALLGFFIITAGSCVYGYFEGLLTSPLFYLAVLISSAAIPAAALFTAYLLLVAVLFIFRRMRRKNIITGIAAALMVVVLMLFSFSFQNLMTHAGDSAYFTESSQTGTLSVVSRAGRIFPPAALFTQAVAGPERAQDADRPADPAHTSNFSISGSARTAQSGAPVGARIIAMAAQLFIITSIFFILLPLIAPLYERSTDGFNETAVKKLSDTETSEYIGKTIRSSKPFKALLIRDIRIVFRESVFFTNGPMIIPLLIVMVLIGIIAGGEEVKQSIAALVPLLDRIQTGENPELVYIYITALACSLAAVFSGTSTSISATSFSREGKAMSYLKALPVSAQTIVQAKAAHAYIYSLVTLILVLPVPAVLDALGLIELSAAGLAAVYALIIWLTASLSVLLHSTDLLVDMKRPKLDWENPVAAFKQNINSVISVFSSMGLCALIGAAGFTVLPKHPASLAVLAAVTTAAAVLVWKKCISSAPSKIADMV